MYRSSALRSSLSSGPSIASTRVTTAAVVVSLALGLGANLAVFLLANALLLSPVPGVADQDELVVLQAREQALPGGRAGFRPLLSYPAMLELERRSHELDSLAAVPVAPVHLQVDDRVERRRACFFSPAFFRTVGLRPAMGSPPTRDATPDDLWLGHESWRRDFAADPEVLGRVVRVGERPFRVRGVLPAGFRGIWRDEPSDLWLPVESYPRILPDVAPALLADPESRWILWWVGRLRAGADLQSLQRELDSLAASDARVPALEAASGIGVRPAKRDDLRQALLLLGAMSALLLAVAVANTGNLLMVKVLERQRETAIAIALGADRWRLLRRGMLEVLALTAAGCAAGLLAATVIGRALRGVPLGRYLPPIDQVPLDARVAGAALGLVVLTASLAALAPVARTLATEPRILLAAGRDATQRRRFLPMKILAIAQIALSGALLIGALSLTRSFLELSTTDPGFVPESVVNLRLDLGPSRLPEEAVAERWLALLADVESVPGVTSASLGVQVPLVQHQDAGRMAAVRAAGSVGEAEWIAYNPVGPGYFSTLGIPLLRGREPTVADRHGAPPVVVVERELARRLWPGGSPIGEYLEVGGVPHEVIGEVGAVKRRSLDEPYEPYFYRALLQSSETIASLHVRSDRAPRDLLVAVRARLREWGPNVPDFATGPYVELMREATSRERLAAVFAIIVSLIATLLAGLGLFALLGRVLIARWSEFALRLALGGQPREIRAIALGQGLGLTGAGLAAGLGLAVPMHRWLRSGLEVVAPLDPGVVLGAAGVLLAVALLASWPLARRAARLSPMTHLRH